MIKYTRTFDVVACEYCGFDFDSPDNFSNIEQDMRQHEKQCSIEHNGKKMDEEQE